MIRRDGPMSPLDRALIGAIGLVVGAGILGVIAFAGPLLRATAG